MGKNMISVSMITMFPCQLPKQTRCHHHLRKYNICHCVYTRWDVSFMFPQEDAHVPTRAQCLLVNESCISVCYYNVINVI